MVAAPEEADAKSLDRLDNAWASAELAPAADASADDSEACSRDAVDAAAGPGETDGGRREETVGLGEPAGATPASKKCERACGLESAGSKRARRTR